MIHVHPSASPLDWRLAPMQYRAFDLDPVTRVTSPWLFFIVF